MFFVAKNDFNKDDFNFLPLDLMHLIAINGRDHASVGESANPLMAVGSRMKG